MENRKIRIDRTAALIRNHAERRAGNYIALKLPRKKKTKKYMQIFGEWKVENRKIRIDRTAALIRNHAERRAGNYIALKPPRKKNTKKYMQIFGGWKVENRKIRIDQTATLIRNHAERRAGNYIALKLPRKKTAEKEKYKEIYANFRGVEGGKPENPDRPDRCAHPEPCGEMAGNYIALKLPRKKTAEKENGIPRKKNTKKYMQIFGGWKVENRKIRIDRTAALIRNHAEGWRAIILP